MSKVRVLYFLLLILILSACNNSKDIANYKRNLERAADQIVTETEKASDMLDKYSLIWEYSIERKRELTAVAQVASVTGLSERKIREHFEVNDHDIVSMDFSKNVHSMMSHLNNRIEISKRRAENTKEKVSNLSDPVKGFDKAYEELLDMYDLYEKHHEMLINPSGSLQDFNSDKRELETEITSKRKRIDVVIPSD